MTTNVFITAWKKLGSPETSFECWLNSRCNEYCKEAGIQPEKALVSSAEFKTWFNSKYGYLDSVKLD